MNSQEEQSQVTTSKGLSRRSFIKGAGAAVGVVVTNRLAETAEAAEKFADLIEKENPQDLEIPLSEILSNPLKYIDQFVEGLRALPEDQKKSGDQNFINLFSAQYSETPEVAARNRNTLHNGYVKKRYGPQIAELVARARDAQPNVSDGEKNKASSSLEHKMLCLRPTYRALEMIVDPYNDDSAYLSDLLIDVVEWFEPLDEPEPEEAYKQKAQKLVEESNLSEHQQKLLAIIRKTASREFLEDLGMDATDANAAIKLGEILKLQEDMMPMMLVGVENVFTHDHPLRAYFGDDRHIHMSDELNNLQQSGYRGFLAKLIHEEAHGLDPDRDSWPKMFKLVHPDNLLAYNEKYLEAFEVVSANMRAMNAVEIELTVIDPAMQIEIGNDGLDDSQDLGQFIEEMEIVNNVVRFASTREGQSLVQEFGMEHFFSPESKDPLLVWPMIDFALPGQTPGRVITHISEGHVNELIEYARQTSGDGQNQFDQDVVNKLVKVKSVYLTASWSFLDRFAQTKGIPQAHDMYTEYMSLMDTYNWSILHRMTGPALMYGLGASDLSQDPVELVENEINSNINLQRADMADHLPGKKYPDSVSRMHNEVYYLVAAAQLARAKLSGVKDPVETYREFVRKSEEILNSSS